MPAMACVAVAATKKASCPQSHANWSGRSLCGRGACHAIRPAFQNQHAATTYQHRRHHAPSCKITNKSTTMAIDNMRVLFSQHGFSWIVLRKSIFWQCAKHNRSCGQECRHRYKGWHSLAR
jgi:hypothetical protein